MPDTQHLILKVHEDVKPLIKHAAATAGLTQSDFLRQAIARAVASSTGAVLPEIDAQSDRLGLRETGRRRRRRWLGKV